MAMQPSGLGERRRRFRRIPVRTLAPNIVTLLALCAGLTAIRMAFENRYVLALAAIVFAAILDGIDGRLARLLKGTSRFGAELDSLSDFVNFGVAPALILYFWDLHELKSAGWIAAMVFAICAGLRLARFNVMIDDPDRPAWTSNFFVGMPAPAGAITVLLPIYAVFLGLPRSGVLTWLTLVYTLVVASLMVSRLPVFSGKRVGMRVPPEMVGPLIVLVVLSIALLLAYPWIVLTAGTLAYLGCLPFGWLSYRGYERRSRDAKRAKRRRRRQHAADGRCARHARCDRPTRTIGRRASIEPHRRRSERLARDTMRVARRTFWLRLWRRWPLPAVIRLARADAPHCVEAASRLFRGVERARQVPGALGAQGRGGFGRPHSHRSVSVDAARRRAGAARSTRSATVLPTSPGPRRA